MQTMLMPGTCERHGRLTATTGQNSGQVPHRFDDLSQLLHVLAMDVGDEIIFWTNGENGTHGLCENGVQTG